MPKLFERKGPYVIMDRREPTLGKCEMCGVEDDLRPYGPNDESICFDCAMKNEPAAKAKFEQRLKGDH